MHRPGFIHIFSTLAFLLVQALAFQAANAASEWQSHAAIRGVAQQFIERFAEATHQGRTEVTLGQLDRRLRLKACTQPLEAFLPQGGREMGNTTVGVSCPGDAGWRIYVSARIDVYGPVLVARQPLARGARITDADLDRVERNLSNLPYGYYTDAGPIVGQLAKRTIAAATVITPTLLQPPRLVKRGERVSIVAETGALKIRSAGKALADGKSGDLIRVRAEGSQRIVDGIVVSEGVVKVTL